MRLPRVGITTSCPGTEVVVVFNDPHGLLELNAQGVRLFERIRNITRCGLEAAMTLEEVCH